MNLPKAIEIAEDAIVGIESVDDPDLPDALKLLIEAGKYVQRHSPYGYAYKRELLPGETED